MEKDGSGEEIIRRLTAISRETFTKLSQGVKPPDSLLHFTDASGVVGILSERNLRASWIFGLNDAAEVHYGIDLARQVISERIATASLQPFRELFLNRALEFLDIGSIPPDQRIYTDHFVVSFCPVDNDTSAQWLHYGRGGDGYAIEFATSGLELEPFDLAKVIYRREDQRSVIETMVAALENAFLDLGFRRDVHTKAATCISAARLLAWTLLVLSARFKNPAFESENEWRLITMHHDGPMVDRTAFTPSEMNFRALGNRVVPFICTPHKELPVRSVCVGSKVDLAGATQAIRLLTASGKYPEPIRVWPSSVPLR